MKARHLLLRRIFLIAALLVTLIPITGCRSLLHELKPHRLRRWNYSDPPSYSDGALFSVPDRVPEPPVKKP